MPIDWSQYHPNFKKRGPACIKRAKYTCQECGRMRGDEYLTKGGKIDKIVIQAHHPNHDRMNPRAKLIALCEPCHLKADGGYHQQVKRRKAREAEIQAGQMTLPGFEGKKRKKGSLICLTTMKHSNVSIKHVAKEAKSSAR